MPENLLPLNPRFPAGAKLPANTITEQLPLETRPEAFSLRIHSGMLETMGHNMYSSVAKCLAEFVANAYDADAEHVEIHMDFERINSAKTSFVRMLALRRMPEHAKMLQPSMTHSLRISLSEFAMMVTVWMRMKFRTAFWLSPATVA